MKKKGEIWLTIDRDFSVVIVSILHSLFRECGVKSQEERMDPNQFRAEQ